jgi:hypothetical protein
MPVSSKWSSLVPSGVPLDARLTHIAEHAIEAGAVIEFAQLNRPQVLADHGKQPRHLPV